MIIAFMKENVRANVWKYQSITTNISEVVVVDIRREVVKKLTHESSCAGFSHIEEVYDLCKNISQVTMIL